MSDRTISVLSPDSDAKIRPVHYFLALAGLCLVVGFICNTYGGVNIYYQDLFAGVQLKGDTITAHSKQELYSIYKRLLFLNQNHPEMINCDKLKSDQTQHSKMFGQKSGFINANYDVCIERKAQYIYFPIVSALWALMAAAFAMFAVFRGRSGVFLFASALLAIATALLLVSVTVVTRNTSDVRVKFDCSAAQFIPPNPMCCSMVCGAMPPAQAESCGLDCYSDNYCVDCCDEICQGVRENYTVFLVGTSLLCLSMLMFLATTGSSFRTKKVGAIGPQDLAKLFWSEDSAQL